MSVRHQALLSASLVLLLGGCAVSTGAANPASYPLTEATAQHDPTPMPPAPVVQTGAMVGPKLRIHHVHEAQAATARVESANHQALREPTSAGYINAAQIYPFSDNALYRLYAAPGHVTDIALESGETLSAISAGDTVRWAVGDTASGTGTSRQVHVMVKPFAAGLTTNLVILTDKRADLEVLARGLLEFETLSGDEIKDLINGKRPVRESVIEPTGPRSSAVPPAGTPRPRPAPPTGDVAPQPQG